MGFEWEKLRGRKPRGAQVGALSPVRTPDRLALEMMPLGKQSSFCQPAEGVLCVSVVRVLHAHPLLRSGLGWQTPSLIESSLWVHFWQKLLVQLQERKVESAPHMHLLSGILHCRENTRYFDYC